MSLLFRCRAAFGLVILVVALFPLREGMAQTVSGGATASTASHHLLGDRLAGGGASVLLPSRHDWLSFHVGAERLHGTAERFGIPCGGMIRPGTCPPEPLEDRARLYSASGGVVLNPLTRRRVNVDMTFDWMVAHVRVDTRGLTTGGGMNARKAMWGPQVGLVAHWRPVARVPLSLDAGWALGRLSPVREERIMDGYTPFEESFEVRRVHAGASWRWGGR